MQPYELDAQSLAPIIEKLSNNPENFVDFRMKFESEIEKPDHARFLVSYYFCNHIYFFIFLYFLLSLLKYFHRVRQSLEHHISFPD